MYNFLNDLVKLALQIVVTGIVAQFLILFFFGVR